MPKRNYVEVVNQQAKLDQIMTDASVVTDDSQPLSQQIQTLQDRYKRLNAAQTDISDNLTNYRGKFNVTPTQAVSNIGTAKTNINTQITSLEALLLKRQNFAARVALDPSKGQQRGDGNCYIHFVNVGMGDCTIVATPLGRTIMIDCGSDSLADAIIDPQYDPSTGLTATDYIRNVVKAPTFLNGANRIDLLLLTHPDADHHNKLQPVLSPLKATIGFVYFGGADKIEAYTGTSAYLKQVAGKTSSVLRKVTIREEAVLDANKNIVVTKAINNTAVTKTTGTPNQGGDEFIDPVTGAMVVYYEDDPKSDFKLSLLAGNVSGVWNNGEVVYQESKLKQASEMKLDSTPANQGCLMILIQCFGQSVLVCGDSTTVTERFAVDYFPSTLASVAALRLAHHGSPTSSGAFFVNALTGLKSAFASTGGAKTVLHALPKQRILNLYPTKVASNAKGHSIFSFQASDQKAQPYFNGIMYWLFATGSNDTISFPIPKS